MCSQAVFYFSCDCGSQVFFDELGVPWPIHDCDTSYYRGLDRRKSSDGTISVRLSEHVAVERRPEKLKLDDELLGRLGDRSRGPSPDPIVRIPASPGKQLSVTGVLRELNRLADPARSLGVPNTTMGRAFLGRIGTEPVGKITVHEGSLLDDILRSITAWVPRKLISLTGLGRGTLVRARFAGVNVKRSPEQWLCEALEIVK